MEKKESALMWIPIWIDKHLWGSTRHELDPAQRSVWTDLYVISGKDNGHIRANKGVPYPTSQLAGMLVVEEKLLIETINICINKEKLKRLEDGTLYVCNYEEFRFSARYRRMLSARKKEIDKEKEDREEEKEKQDITEQYSTVQSIRKTETQFRKTETEFTEEELNTIYLDLKLLKYPFKTGDMILHLQDLKKEFPDVDIIEEFKKKCIWWKDNPKRLDKKKSNPLLQMRNWICIAQKRINEAKQGDRIGGQTHIIVSDCHEADITLDKNDDYICDKCKQRCESKMKRKEKK